MRSTKLGRRRTLRGRRRRSASGSGRCRGRCPSSDRAGGRSLRRGTFGPRSPHRRCRPRTRMPRRFAFQRGRSCSSAALRSRRTARKPSGDAGRTCCRRLRSCPIRTPWYRCNSSTLHRCRSRGTGRSAGAPRRARSRCRARPRDRTLRTRGIRARSRRRQRHRPVRCSPPHWRSPHRSPACRWLRRPRRPRRFLPRRSQRSWRSARRCRPLRAPAPRRAPPTPKHCASVRCPRQVAPGRAR